MEEYWTPLKCVLAAAAAAQGELDSKNKALFFFTPGAYSIVLIFANFRPGAYSVVLIYISAEPVPIVLISGI